MGRAAQIMVRKKNEGSFFSLIYNIRLLMVE